MWLFRVLDFLAFQRKYGVIYLGKKRSDARCDETEETQIEKILSRRN